ncbi:SPOR domain-containing protein [Kordiimonas aestuarii]|uniref:SPOR domain-containing protein n=1 Tax=Kordiimonas aestuarii TaxID=1005925 RepID=UPI0021D24BAA|nr:SPOR domain-containing protein [Kordiimonas aestuarii]
MIAAQKFPTGQVARGAIVACFAFILGGCQSSNLWQGEEVLVEARQTTLERSVGNVSENHRELKDRFNALERLYVDLVRSVRTQSEHLQAIDQKLANFQKDPEVDANLNKVKTELQAVRKDMKAMENRLYSVEVTDRQAAYTPQANSVAPTGSSQTGADADPTAVSSTPGAAAPTPVENRAPMTSQTYYGAHLASYRSNDQVSSGWNSLLKAFGSELTDLKPLIYTQSQEGIGTFLRLIVGPLESEGDAEALCDRIRATGGEQYCRVSEYQGEPIG